MQGLALDALQEVALQAELWLPWEMNFWPPLQAVLVVLACKEAHHRPRPRRWLPRAPPRALAHERRSLLRPLARMTHQAAPAHDSPRLHGMHRLSVALEESHPSMPVVSPSRQSKHRVCWLCHNHVHLDRHGHDYDHAHRLGHSAARPRPLLLQGPCVCHLDLDRHGHDYDHAHRLGHPAARPRPLLLLLLQLLLPEVQTQELLQGVQVLPVLPVEVLPVEVAAEVVPVQLWR